MALNYDPWKQAAELEIEIVEGALPVRWRGAYHHDSRLIILTPGMSLRESRSTLTHEIQHALAGDVLSPFGPLRKKQEYLARARTVNALICPIEYASCEELHNFHLPSIAHALNVTNKIVKDWHHFRASRGSNVVTP